MITTRGYFVGVVGLALIVAGIGVDNMSVVMIGCMCELIAIFDLSEPSS